MPINTPSRSQRAINAINAINAMSRVEHKLPSESNSQSEMINISLASGTVLSGPEEY